MEQQYILLAIEYDPDEVGEPKDWDWPTILHNEQEVKVEWWGDAVKVKATA